MSRRRGSCPQATQRLWDAIKITRYQRQIPDLDRIARYMGRVHDVSREVVAEQLELCVGDGLIVSKDKVGARGSKIGVQQKGYFLPNQPATRDDYDWYCFLCHSSGDVVGCNTCWRVYHSACLAGDSEPQEVWDNAGFVCNVCKECATGKDELETKIKKKVLNQLLGYTCQLLAGQCPVSLLTREVPSSGSYIAQLNSTAAETSAEPPLESSARGWVTDQDDEWRADQLIYQAMDLVAIRAKTERGEYQRVNELKADVETLVHNMVVYHGTDHEVTTSVRKMLTDCAYDLSEIRRCPDCYRTSNEQSGRWWFCEPCRPPHRLVYAKQGSYPYWPAKVMRTEEDGALDVRFFGGAHQRAVIAAGSIRPITADLDSMHIKRTASWNKAEEELKVHQEKLKQEKPENVYDFNSSDDEELAPAVVEKRKSIAPLPAKKAVKKARRETGGSEPPVLDAMSPAAKASATVAKAGVSEEDMVSSSSQDLKGVLRSKAVQTALVKPMPTKTQLAKLRREHEQALRRAVEVACRDLRRQMEETHAAEMQTLRDEHATELSEVKLKQWCFNCEKEAIYHCCWNTAYCSTKCQQDHWITQHKPHCRRKRV